MNGAEENTCASFHLRGNQSGLFSKQFFLKGNLMKENGTPTSRPQPAASRESFAQVMELGRTNGNHDNCKVLEGMDRSIPNKNRNRSETFKVSSLEDLCLEKAIDNVKHIVNMRGIVDQLLERILPHCNAEELKNIED
ncbi:hypothetical protein ACET3Z_021762 [Daucus carota]